MPSYELSRVEKDELIAEEFYWKAVDLDIEEMAEAGDKYAQTYLGWMYRYGCGVYAHFYLPTSTSSSCLSVHTV